MYAVSGEPIMEHFTNTPRNNAEEELEIKTVLKINVVYEDSNV